ncbi:ADP-ribosylation/Crystallin J1 [Mycena vitilis]|nr:ADP-ribosylation/Crystallin J1 [Mycena vitilis]
MTLRHQSLIPASSATKFRLALLSTALVDALGGPFEFHARFSMPFCAHMLPNANFSLPAGVWTDDTSMALCLARSIATCDGEASEKEVAKDKDKAGGKEEGNGKTGKGGMDAADQLDAYYRWWQDGELSATGDCFDIGNTIQRAMSLYHGALRAAGGSSSRVRSVLSSSLSSSPSKATAEKEKRRAAAHTALQYIRKDLKGAVFGGNGSLMRVLPIGLAYWRRPEAEVGELARESSATTHPNVVCGEACAVWSRCVARVVGSAAAAHVARTEGKEEERMTKLDVLHHFAAFAYMTDPLRKALAADVPLPDSALGDPAVMEAHYAVHHPILRLVLQQQSPSSSTSPPPNSAPDSAVASTDSDSALESHILSLLPPASALPSSGYVVHTLVAALYAFLATRSFEEGALLTAHMGNDADTVGAVFGGLAGVWYACEEGGASTGTSAGKEGTGKEGEEDAFWSPRVREWRDALVRRDIVEEVAEELVAFAEMEGA